MSLIKIGVPKNIDEGIIFRAPFEELGSFSPKSALGVDLVETVRMAIINLADGKYGDGVEEIFFPAAPLKRQPQNLNEAARLMGWSHQFGVVLTGNRAKEASTYWISCPFLSGGMTTLDKWPAQTKLPNGVVLYRFACIGQNHYSSRIVPNEEVRTVPGAITRVGYPQPSDGKIYDLPEIRSEVHNVPSDGSDVPTYRDQGNTSHNGILTQPSGDNRYDPK